MNYLENIKAEVNAGEATVLTLYFSPTHSMKPATNLKKSPQKKNIQCDNFKLRTESIHLEYQQRQAIYCLICASSKTTAK